MAVIDVEILDTIAGLRIYDGSNPANKQTTEVLGYYSEDDGFGGTFYWDPVSTATDDGGFTFQVTGVVTGRWIRIGDHKTIDIKRFGAKGDGVTDDSTYIKNALASTAQTIVVPIGSYLLVSTAAGSLTIPAGKTLIGVDKNHSDIFMTGIVTNPIIKVAADNVVVSNLKLRNPSATNTGSVLRIEQGTTLTIESCIFDGGIYGIHFNPPSNGVIKNVSIRNSELANLKFGIYIGTDGGADITGDHITDVIIDNNLIRDGKDDGSGGDGIKTLRKCNNLIITNNIIRDQIRDAIDLYASGDRVIIANNVFKDNKVKGLDIKSDRNVVDPAIYGTNGQQMTITGNLISGSLSGVSINQGTATPFDYNYLIDISHNQIFHNEQTGLNICGYYVNVSSNMIYDNCQSTAGAYHAVRLGDNTVAGNAKYVKVTDNVIMNNGNNSQVNYGIYVSANCEYCMVKGNILRNDLNIPNPYQKSGLYINNPVKEIGVKDNIIKDHPTNNVVFATGADVIGDLDNLATSSLAAGTGGEFTLLIAKGSAFLASVTFNLANAIAANATNYITVEFIRRRTTPASVLTIASYTTSTNAIIAFLPVTTGAITAVNRSFIPGDVLTVKFTHTGTGQAITNPTFTTNFIET